MKGLSYQFCKHSMIIDHNVEWENTIILKVATDYNKKLLVYSWFIYSKANIINTNYSNSFSL